MTLLNRLTRSMGALACFAACSSCSVQENARTEIGPSGQPMSVSLPVLDAGSRHDTTRTGDARSLAQGRLSRAHWNPMTINVPSDSILGYRTYARQRLWSDETARQRGEFPTPVTALELTNGHDDTSISETLLSGPAAIYDGVLIVPRMFFVSPDEPVRHYPTTGWRAPVFTSRYSAKELTARGMSSEASDPAAAPSRAPARSAEPAPQQVPPPDRP